MAAYVMVTVDLNKTTEEKRKKFNEEMAKLNYTKIKTTTTWTAYFASATESVAIANTKANVAKSAATAGIASYDAAAQAGTTRWSEWTV